MPKYRKAPELVELGALLEEARVRHGLTQAKAARLAGISRRHFVEGLRGHNISVVVLKKMMRTLELVTVNLGDGLSATANIDGVQPAELLALLDAFAKGFAEIDQRLATMREAVSATRAYVQRHLASPRNAQARELVREVRSAHAREPARPKRRKG